MLAIIKNRTMRIIIGLAIVGIGIFFFGWWGLLSLLFVLPFIGWPDRHKGPFPTNQRESRTTDYNSAQNLAEEIPKSFRLMQNILVDTSKKSSSTNDLLPMLNQLRDNLRTEKPFDDNLTDRILLQDFLQQFSTIFPNWHAEYLMLSDLIDSNLD